MSNAESRVAIYTGSFDPVTLGHLNIIERASRLVDRLVVGVGENVEKAYFFEPEERVEMIRASLVAVPNVEVRSFSGLAVKFVREVGARVMLRGVRSLSDMEHEFTMSLANRKLDAGIETVFLMADDEYSHISSSLIKQIATLGGEKELHQFVPESVVKAVFRKIQAENASES